MILNKARLTIAEIYKYVKDIEEKKPIIEYIKRFGRLSKDEVDNMKKDIKALNNNKIKEEHIVKIIDFMPNDYEDINKILSDANLTEQEEHAILEIVRKY